MSETGREPDPAVAAAAAQLIEQAQNEGTAMSAAEAARRAELVNSAFTADPTVPTPLLPGEQAGAPQQTPAEESQGLPQLEADTAGIEHLLEDAPPEEPEEEEPEYQEPDAEDEYADDETKKLRAKVKALEKKTQWLEDQKVKAGQKNWQEEAKRRFPLAPPATYEELRSRNSVLKAAAAAHEQVHKIVEPWIGKIAAAQTTATERATAQARANAVQAWGRPTVGPPEQAIEQAQTAEQAAAMDPSKFRNLAELTAARMKAGLRL